MALPLLTIGNPMPNENIAETVLSAQEGPIVCTKNRDGTGPTNYQVTKDCCAHVHQDRGRNNVYFNEVQWLCTGRGGPLDNGVDWGGMNKCCQSRGAGSDGSSHDENVANFANAFAHGQGTGGPRGKVPPKPQPKGPAKGKGKGPRS
jgi:hypothetical protein